VETLRVLIVEDTENDALLVLHELARGQYDVTHRRVDTSQGLREALDTERWDLVISDFSLPTLTALDVLKVLAQSRLDLPCIVVSGTIQDEAAVVALRSGAHDFIVKDRLARLLPAVSRELREADVRRQRSAAEVSLAETRDRMRFALEAAGVGTWEFDIASGATVWSDVMERLHGQAPGTFQGTFEAFVDAIHPDDRRGVQDQMLKSTRDHTAARLEYQVTWPDGSVHWISGVGQTFYNDAGRAVRAAGVGMDITAQKSLENQVRLAQRMESIGLLAGGIAHDFNNLLTGILGYSKLVLEDLADHELPEGTRRDLEEIHKAGERAAALTYQLLAFSRKQIIQPTVLNINTVIARLEPMLRRLIGEDIELTARLSPELASANTDAGQLEQVLMNLIVNARDALPTGGKITIETSNVELDAAYARTHVAVVPGPFVMFAVSDNGFGMPREVQARIFEPFFTTKTKDRGTGLGLATVYGIVKQSNGSIWVYSEPGHGTTFKVYLPRVGEAPATVTQRIHTGVVTGKETILVVEDDQQVRKFTRDVLMRNGYTVFEASCAEEAQQVAAARSGQIDLVVTDVVMPGVSGRVLAERLSRQYPTMKILFMSGYTDDAIVQHGVLTPGVAFLQKPFTLAGLGRAVRDVLDA